MRRARGYRRCGPPSGRASATTAALNQPPTTPTATQTVTRNPYIQSPQTVLRGPVEPGQYTSIDYTQTLADHGVLASVGSVGDAYDNALAESFVDSFKTELIADRVWRTRAQLELAVVEYIGWFNDGRLHQALGDLPPSEPEQ
jgi:putative transposase